MSTVPPDRPGDEDDASAAEFAATVAEALTDTDDPEALPGAMPVDDRALQTLPTIGHVGRYALKYQLGAGGLGTVYAALDPLLSRPIAVKTVHVDASAEQREALESQLLAEARAAAGLNHPHIVTVYDAGPAEEGVYIAMERLQGRDLRDLLADGWRPEPVQAVRIAKRIADALAYAHDHGVIHCDIKPANIYMIGRTQPKVLDFGIARVTQQQHHPDAVQGAIEAVDISSDMTSLSPAEIGSPYYVAPEQLHGATLDERCDVYGVGVVLYELLTGRRAFEGRSLENIRYAVLEADVTPVQKLNRNVNGALSEIVARAMARNPAQRFRTARQLARALRNWLEEEASQRGAAPLGRKHWAWTAFGGLGLAAAAAFWIVGLGRDDASSTGEMRAALPSETTTAPIAAPGRTATGVVQAPAPDSASATSPVVAAAASAATPPKAVKAVKAQATETVRERERRLVRETAAAAAPVTPAAPAPTQGVVQLAISPWGNVEIDGVAAGTTPPLSRLTLPAGKHKIVVRNEDFPPFTSTVTVDGDKPVTLRHRFGS